MAESNVQKSYDMLASERRETKLMDTDESTATEQLLVELQRILDLAGPARAEITKLENVYHRQPEEKAKQESGYSNETVELHSKLSLAYEEKSKLLQQLEECQTFNKTKSAALEAANAAIQKLEKSILEQENKHKEAVDAYKDVNFSTEKMLASKSKEIEDLQNSIDNLREKATAIINDKEKEIKRLNDSVKQTKKEKENVAKELSETKSSLGKLLASKSKEIEDLQISKDNLREKAKTIINDKEKEMKRLQDSVQQSKIEKQKVTKELSETKSRLSKLMGDKLSDKNPDIADLSDENRPTKLAEKYQELYDNQWTDAYELLEKNYKTEKENIHSLLTILMEIHMFCKEEAESQKQELIKAVYRTQSIEKANLDKPVNIKEFLKQIKRSSATETIRNLTEKFLHIKTTESSETLYKTAKDYVHECMTLCWMMERHDPPLVLLQSVHRGEQFGSSKYKHYTCTGTVVEYVVWPALLLHHEGPLLCKGVVQCTGPLQGSKSFKSGLYPKEPKEVHIPAGSVRLLDNGTSLSKTIWIPGVRGHVGDKTVDQTGQVSTSGHTLTRNDAFDQQHIKASQQGDTDKSFWNNDSATNQSPQMFHSEIKTQLQVTTTSNQHVSSNPAIIDQTPFQTAVGNNQHSQINRNIQYPGQASLSANEQQANDSPVYKDVLNEPNQPLRSANTFRDRDQSNQSTSLDPFNQSPTNYQGATQQQSSVASNIQYSQYPPHLIPTHHEMSIFYQYNNCYATFELARYYMGIHFNNKYLYDKCWKYWIWCNQQNSPQQNVYNR